MTTAPTHLIREETAVHALLRGVLAGAAGTFALNATTYADMLWRARPASKTPAEVAGRVADLAGIEVGEQQQAANRKQAAGALLGHVTGLGVAVLYALGPSGLRRLPSWVTGPLLGAAAMAGSDVPAAALGVTDPTMWDSASWLSDVIPHMAYGTTTSAVHKALG